jgi:type IV pilus assembly protein PilC
VTSLYYYTARTVEGAFVRGCVEAGSSDLAAAHLQGRSLFITSIEGARGTRGAVAGLFHIGRVSRPALVTFFRSLATLVAAGVAMRRSLEVAIAQCHDGRLREALAAVLFELERGLPLSDALACRPREFDRVVVAMIRAGEVGGILDEVLSRIAEMLERGQEIRKRLLAALTYPAIVSAAATALVGFLLFTIAPMFRSLYAQLHVPLPPMTRALLALSALFASPRAWGAAAAAAVGASIALSRVRLDGVCLALPLAGTILRRTTYARLARVVGTLLASGVGLIAALEVAAQVLSNARFRESVVSLRTALDEGSSFAAPLERSGLYEPMFAQLVRIGEETGSLDAMLLRLAAYYESDVDAMLGALGSALEPVLILLLGGAVGLIVAAIFIPLYTLIGNIR